jgi:hypothetical protein
MHKWNATKVTIRTEGGPSYTAEAKRLLDGWFTGWSTTEGEGSWHGKRESSLVITLIQVHRAADQRGIMINRLPGDGHNGRWFTFEDYVTFFVKALNEANGQDCCLVEYSETFVNFI